MDNRTAWEQEAENWVRWARTPSHDAYWYYRDSFFDSIIPSPGRRRSRSAAGRAAWHGTLP